MKRCFSFDLLHSLDLTTAWFTFNYILGFFSLPPSSCFFLCLLLCSVQVETFIILMPCFVLNAGLCQSSQGNNNGVGDGWRGANRRHQLLGEDLDLFDFFYHLTQIWILPYKLNVFIYSLQEEVARENQQKIEAEKQTVDEAKRNFDGHQKMVEDVSCQYSSVRDRIDQLSEEMEPLKVQHHTVVLLCSGKKNLWKHLSAKISVVLMLLPLCDSK